MPSKAEGKIHVSPRICPDLVYCLHEAVGIRTRKRRILPGQHLKGRGQRMSSKPIVNFTPKQLAEWLVKIIS